MSKQVVNSPLSLLGELKQRRNTYEKRGLSTGWKKADEFMSLKKGYPIMIGGYAGSGKSEVAFDIAINSSVDHDWLWLIVSPETGDQFEIMEYLIEKVAQGKHIGKKYQGALSDDEYESIVKWLHKHIRILDRQSGWDDVFTGLDFSLKNLFEVVENVEKQLKGKFDGIIIDPFNELDLNLGGNIAGTVKDELDALIRYTKKNNYLTILTNHANNRHEIQSKDENGKSFFWKPPATKEEWAFGQQFARKGYQMLFVYEPPMQFQHLQRNEGNVDFMESINNNYNVREILCQKTKPKGVGKTGKFCLHFDRQHQRYYEIDSLGMKKKIKYPKL